MFISPLHEILQDLFLRNLVSSSIPFFRQIGKVQDFAENSIHSANISAKFRAIPSSEANLLSVYEWQIHQFIGKEGAILRNIVYFASPRNFAQTFFLRNLVCLSISSFAKLVKSKILPKIIDIKWKFRRNFVQSILAKRIFECMWATNHPVYWQRRAILWSKYCLVRPLHEISQAFFLAKSR